MNVFISVMLAAMVSKQSFVHYELVVSSLSVGILYMNMNAYPSSISVSRALYIFIFDFISLSLYCEFNYDILYVCVQYSSPPFQPVSDYAIGHRTVYQSELKKNIYIYKANTASMEVQLKGRRKKNEENLLYTESSTNNNSSTDKWEWNQKGTRTPRLTNTMNKKRIEKFDKPPAKIFILVPILPFIFHFRV